MESGSVGAVPLRAYSARELSADRQIHRIGIAAGIAGAAWLIDIAARSGRLAILLPVATYAAGLVAMLSFSAAYNLARSAPRRALLRRFDHAAIFVMIAGTCTPFTLGRPGGAWSLGATAAIWATALAGAGLKLAAPQRLERLSLGLYLGLGWLALAALAPLVATLDGTTLLLLAGGGVLYTAGTAFHVRHRLPYQNAVWHGFVLAGAACHYWAVVRLVAGAAG